jgi:hypothetical protein
MKTCSEVLELFLWTDGGIDTGEFDFVSSLRRKRFDTFGMLCEFYLECHT